MDIKKNMRVSHNRYPHRYKDRYMANIYLAGKM